MSSQAVLILAWVGATFSTVWSGPQLLSPLVALLGAVEFWGTWTMTRSDPWSLERPEAARRAHRLRWASGVAAVLGMVAASAGQAGWQAAAILDRVTGVAWVVQVYFVVARFEDLARRLGNHRVANTAGRTKWVLTIGQLLWEITLLVVALRPGPGPFNPGTLALLFALLAFLPGAFGSWVGGVVAFAVSLQLRAALERAWRQSRAVLEGA